MCSVKSDYFVKLIKPVIIVFGLASIILFFYQSIRNHNYINGNDLTAYLKSSQLFINGENPYTSETRPYMYPLFLTIVSYPLTFLQSGYIQKAIAASIWSLTAWFAFFMTVITSWRYLHNNQLPKGIAHNYLFLSSLLILMVHPFMQSEFYNGQVNLFILGGIAGYFFMLERRKQFSAALFLAVAASIKIAPGLCLLYIIFTRQYRTAVYFFLMMFLFTVAVPYLVNNQSLIYYKYFFSESIPRISASELGEGFNTFSIISTVSYLFNIHWTPPLRITAICVLVTGLFTPIIIIARKYYNGSESFFRFLVLSAIVISFPLAFPISERHHLLILIIPFLAVLAYWYRVVNSGNQWWKDRLLVTFIICLILLHIGHGLKETPLRLIALIGIYINLVLTMKKTGESRKLELS